MTNRLLESGDEACEIKHFTLYVYSIPLGFAIKIVKKMQHLIELEQQLQQFKEYREFLVFFKE